MASEIHDAVLAWALTHGWTVNQLNPTRFALSATPSPARFSVDFANHPWVCVREYRVHMHPLQCN